RSARRAFPTGPHPPHAATPRQGGPAMTQPLPHPGRVPEEFHTITPHICVRGVAAAVEFYREVFGAHELYRSLGPAGANIRHCEMLMGVSRFFLVEENSAYMGVSPLTLGGTPVAMHVYVPDADATFARAVAAGAAVIVPVQDCFWGD